MNNNKILILFIILIVGLFLLPTGDVEQVRLDRSYEGPSSEFKLGTDHLGRDFYSLLIEGGKRTVFVTLLASSISLFAGTALGMLAGYYEGFVLTLIQFFADLFMVVPSFVIALIFTSIWGLTPLSAAIMLGITGIPGFIYHSMTLTQKVKQEDFFQNEKIIGIRGKDIVWRHIFPHIIQPILTAFGNNAGGVIINYASLSFIGLGSDITNPDWGAMLYQYRVYIIEHPRLIFWPTLGIFLLALLFNFTFDNRSFIGEKRGSLYG